MSPYTHYPVIIIGGGPAGSGAALFLGKYKIKHLVLEKAAFPREKICGDGLTPNVVKLMDIKKGKSWKKGLLLCFLRTEIISKFSNPLCSHQYQVIVSLAKLY